MELPLNIQPVTVLQEEAEGVWTHAANRLYLWQALKQQTQNRKLDKKPWFMSVRVTDCVFIFLACPPASDQSMSDLSQFLMPEETIHKLQLFGVLSCVWQIDSMVSVWTSTSVVSSPPGYQVRYIYQGLTGQFISGWQEKSQENHYPL